MKKANLLVVVVLSVLACAKNGYSDDIPVKIGGQNRTDLAVNPYPGGHAEYAIGQSARKLTMPKIEGQEMSFLKSKPISFDFDLSESYNDNIFLSSNKSNQRFDFITSIGPRVSFAGGNSENFCYASYHATQLLYAIVSNKKTNRIKQDAQFMADLFQDSAVKMRISDNWMRTTDPTSSETNDQVRRMSNELDCVVKYDISPKSALALEYNQSVQNYLDPAYKTNSYLANTGSPIFYWYLSPKTTLTAQYDASTECFYNNTALNDMYQQIRFGIKEQVTPKILLDLKGGYQYRMFSTTESKDLAAPVFSGTLDYEFNKNVGLHAFTIYTIEDSVSGISNYMRSLSLGTSIQYRKYDIGFSVGGFYNKNSYPSEVLKTDGVNSIKQDITTYTLFVRGEYKLLKWLAFYMEYDYRIGLSNTGADQPTNNITTFGAKANF